MRWLFYMEEGVRPLPARGNTFYNPPPRPAYGLLPAPGGGGSAWRYLVTIG